MYKSIVLWCKSGIFVAKKSAICNYLLISSLPKSLNSFVILYDSVSFGRVLEWGHIDIAKRVTIVKF